MDNFDNVVHDDKLGEVKIADDVMAVCAINAVLRTPGVSGLIGGFTDTITEAVRRKESMSKGIKVNQTDEGIILDVYIAVEYGVKIPVVAWDVQKNVKKELETMVDRPVLEVNIHVQAVADKEETQNKKDKPSDRGYKKIIKR